MARILSTSRESPIRQVPDDVLREIFVHCLQSSSGPPTLSETEGPLQLSHVCMNWRAVALDFPRLWRSLLVRRRYLQRKTVDDTQLWLLRGSGAPIHLQLVITSRIPYFIRVLRACLDHETRRSRAVSWGGFRAMREDTVRRRRWEDLLDTFFHSSPIPPPPSTLSKMLKPVGASITRLLLRGVPLSNLVHLPRRTFPNLERLILVLIDRLEYSQFDWISYGSVKAFLDCPSLRRIALGRFFRGEHQEFIQLPLKQLTHLIDCGPFYDSEEHACTTVARAVSTARDLRLFHVSFDEERRSNLVRQPLAQLDRNDTTFNALETLSVESSARSGNAEFFLTTFTFPNLRSLRFLGHPHELRRFFESGKGALLERLSITGLETVNLEYIQAISQHAPKVWALEVISDDLVAFFTALNQGTSPRLVPFPNLRFLSVRWAGLSGSMDSMVKQFIAKLKQFAYHHIRNSHSQQLQAVQIIHGAEDWEAAERLRDVFLGCWESVGAELTVTLTMTEHPDCVADSLLTDPELMDWEGLQELVTKGRGEWKIV